MPEKTEELIATFKDEARKNNVFPLDHRFGAARANMAAAGMPTNEIEYWGKDVSVPAQGGGPYLGARSYTIEADLVLDSDSASGVVLAAGSRFGGLSLYLDEGKPMFVWAEAVDPEEIWTARSERALPAGKTSLTMRFAAPRPGGPAKITLSSGGEEYASVDIPQSIIMFAGNGETLDIGRDMGVPVADYHVKDGAIEGDVPHVKITFDPMRRPGQ
jgi:arylsulfatase